MRQIFKWINVFLGIGVFLIALGIAYVAVPYFGNQALIVRSGSMSPAIDAGSIVVVRPNKEFISPIVSTPLYNSGDIIAFRSENNPKTIITHRIVGSTVKDNNVLYKTKGDANDDVDGWMVNQKDIVGKSFFTVPYAGYLLAFAKSDTGFPLLIIVPAALVVLLEFFNIVKEIRNGRKTRIAEIRSHLRHPLHLSGLKVFVPLIIIGLSIPIAFAFPSDTEKSHDNLFTAARDFGSSPSVTPTPTGINPGDVVINEIMWMGSSVNSADEWIELRNITSNTVDLSNWVIEKLGSGTNSVTIPSGKSIAPNGFFFIANDPKETGAHDVDPDLVTNISLLNSPSEQLVLRISSGGTIIDTADDNLGGWFAGVSGTGQNPDKSMERNNAPGDGTVSANWHTATTQVNLDPTASDSATPKAANGL